jgi:hypothetical protein
MEANVYFNYYTVQSGAGLTDIGPLYYHQRMIQHGRGIGSFFAALYKYLKPVFLSGVSALKDQALKTGSSVLNEFGNRPFTEIIKDHGKKAVQELEKKFQNKFQGGSGIFAYNTLEKRYKKTKLNKKKNINSSIVKNKKKKKIVKDSQKKTKVIKTRVLDIFSKKKKN